MKFRHFLSLWLESHISNYPSMVCLPTSSPQNDTVCQTAKHKIPSRVRRFHVGTYQPIFSGIHQSFEHSSSDLIREPSLFGPMRFPGESSPSWLALIMQFARPAVANRAVFHGPCGNDMEVTGVHRLTNGSYNGPAQSCRY